MKRRTVVVHWANGSEPSVARITHRYKTGKMVVTGEHFTICLYPSQEIGSEGWDESMRQALCWEYPSHPSQIIDVSTLSRDDYEFTPPPLEVVPCGRAHRKERHLPHKWSFQLEDDSPARMDAQCPGWQALVDPRSPD